MKSFKLIIIILVIFLKTGNVLSDNNLFHVNNVEILYTTPINNEEKAKQAIRKGFKELTTKLLLDEDAIKLKQLKYYEIRNLVSYYQIIEEAELDLDKEKKQSSKYNILFDKNKLHDLFYKMNISYSDIIQYELYFLPIFKKDDQIFIFNQNFFYKNWNLKEEQSLIEFILPLENIEIIEKINLNKNNIISIQLQEIFKEYANKNLVLAIIEENNKKVKKIFLKSKIMGKNVNKNITIKKENNVNQREFYENIISIIKKEIVHLIKSQNLIDIKTPSFINAKFSLDKNNTLVELNKGIKKIELIENMYVQELNKEYVDLKIKYLGKINKIIQQLRENNIILKLVGDQWILKIIS